MARPQRKDVTPAPGAMPGWASQPVPTGPWSDARENGACQPGGRVGQMHAELVQRLAGVAPAALPLSPEERVVRSLSVAGGYAALLAAYAGVVLLILR